MQWIIDHYSILTTILLGVSEILSLIFPPESGVGGILAGIIKALKKAGVKFDRSNS